MHSPKSIISLKSIIIFYLICTTTFAFSQVEIGMENGIVHKHHSMKIKRPASTERGRIITEDGSEYYLRNVAYYANEEGYFKKWHKGNGYYEFMKRHLEGSIETYSIMRTNYTTNPNTGMMTMNRSRQDYYSFEGGPIKKMNFKNLKRDIGHIPECRAYLKKGKTISSIGVGAMVVGLGIAITSILNIDVDEPGSNNGPGSHDTSVSIPPGIIIGTALCLGPTLARGPAFKNYNLAIGYYNQHH